MTIPCKSLLALCLGAALLPRPQRALADEAASQAATAVPTADVHLSATSSRGPGYARFASGTGNALFLAAGTLLPLLTDGKAGKEHSIRTIDALAVSTVLAEGLKVLVHEKRPDGSSNTSFPSGHATAAFTVATMQAQFHPKQAPFWYGGATLIAYSRVKLNRHYYHDVIAGAALGYFTAKYELKSRRGLVLRPFIHADGPATTQRVTGLSFERTF